MGRWIALDNLSQIHFERNRASAIICSVDQKPLFRLFLKGPSDPGGLEGGQCPAPFFLGSVNSTQPEGSFYLTATLLKVTFIQKGLVNYFPVNYLVLFHSKWLKSCQIKTLTPYMSIQSSFGSPFDMILAI